jgi:hypothetical protein
MFDGDKHYLRNVTSFRPEWLMELAPKYCQRLLLRQLSVPNYGWGWEKEEKECQKIHKLIVQMICMLRGEGSTEESEE